MFEPCTNKRGNLKEDISRSRVPKQDEGVFREVSKCLRPRNDHVCVDGVPGTLSSVFDVNECDVIHHSNTFH